MAAAVDAARWGGLLSPGLWQGLSGTLLGMSPVSRGRKGKKQKKAQKPRQRAATAPAQRDAAALAALRDQLFRPAPAGAGTGHR